jgi:hypothetical protein
MIQTENKQPMLVKKIQRIKSIHRIEADPKRKI